ncbi:hypothetical protein V8E55_010459 [Tylopilus felleus]
MADAEFLGRKTASPIALGDHEALERYMSTTRSNAVYLPSNIDYGARNNGLEGGATEVFEKLMGSNWALARAPPELLGQSQQYTLSSPPGGYQLFGRTLPAWQTWCIGPDFSRERPWLLTRYCDPFRGVVYTRQRGALCRGHEHSIQIEQEFNAGQYKFEIEQTVFSMTIYTGFVKAIANEVAEFTRKRAEAAAREGARENVHLGEWLAQKRFEASEQYKAGRGDPSLRDLGLPFIHVCLGLESQMSDRTNNQVGG